MSDRQIAIFVCGEKMLLHVLLGVFGSNIMYLTKNHYDRHGECFQLRRLVGRYSSVEDVDELVDIAVLVVLREYNRSTSITIVEFEID